MNLLNKKKNKRNLYKLKGIISKIITKDLDYDLKEFGTLSAQYPNNAITIYFNSKDVYTHSKKQKNNGNNKTSNKSS